MAVVFKQSLLSAAGRGVFAAKNFDEGDYVCAYHDDCTPHSTEINTGKKPYSIWFEKENRWVYGDPDVTCPETCGHIIKDGAMSNLQYPIDQGFNINMADFNKYMFVSLNKQNVVNDGLDFYACKRINKGDELYFNYGYQYWTNGIVDINHIFRNDWSSNMTSEKKKRINKLCDKHNSTGSLSPIEKAITCFKTLKQMLNLVNDEASEPIDW